MAGAQHRAAMRKASFTFTTESEWRESAKSLNFLGQEPRGLLNKNPNPKARPWYQDFKQWMDQRGFSPRRQKHIRERVLAEEQDNEK